MKRREKALASVVMSLVMAVTFIPCFSFAEVSNQDPADAAKTQVMDKMEEADEAAAVPDQYPAGKSADSDEAVPMEKGVSATSSIKINKAYPSLSKYANFVFTPDYQGVYTFRNVISADIEGEELTGYLLDEKGNVVIYADKYSNPDGMGFFFQTTLEKGEKYFLAVTAEYSTNVTVIADNITEEEAALPAMQSAVYDDGTGEYHALYEFMEYRYYNEETHQNALGYYAAEEKTITVPYGAKYPSVTYFEAEGRKCTKSLNTSDDTIWLVVWSVDSKKYQFYKINVLHENEGSMFVYADIYKMGSDKSYAEYDPAKFDAEFASKSTATVKIPKKYWKKKFVFYAGTPCEGTSAKITGAEIDNFYCKTFRPYKTRKVTLQVRTPGGAVRNITFKFKKK